MVKIFYRNLINHKVPVNLNYAWNAGSMALFCLCSQLLTGLLLTIYYIPSVGGAFISVDCIMRDVENGWWVRYMHANGASLFFFVVYLHMMRGFFYGSYREPREHVWVSGVTLLFLMMGIAFMGYVLPWGQMSFWAASVITGLLDVIPFYGVQFLEFLIGGEFIGTSTLLRFYTLHYLLPFVLLSLVLVHIFLLHNVGSGNPLGTGTNLDAISFHWTYTIKDLLGVWLVVYFGSIIIYFYPNVLLHPDNYVPANQLCTPSHIVPEWYFLFFYGLLRSVPDREGGVVVVLGVILCLYLLPYFINAYSVLYSGWFRLEFSFVFWYFIIFLILMSWLGGKPAEKPYVGVAGCVAIIVLWFIFLIMFDIYDNFFFSGGDIKNYVVTSLDMCLCDVKFCALDWHVDFFLDFVRNFRLYFFLMKKHGGYTLIYLLNFIYLFPKFLKIYSLLAVNVDVLFVGYLGERGRIAQLFDGVAKPWPLRLVI